MPIPKPTKEEPEGKFISRCMSNDIMKNEYPDPKQRTAICMDSWKSSKENVSEAVTVTIDEQPNISQINDFDYEINLNEDNIKSIITDKIQGELDAIILFSDNKCEIMIRFASLPDIIIFNDMEYNGTKYIPVRVQTLTNKAELLLSGSAKFILNNQLEIIIKGPKNTNVGVTLRYKNA